MSFHITIDKTRSSSYGDIIATGFLPRDSRFLDVDPQAVVVSLSRIYRPGLSTRGVSLRDLGSEYDVILNTGAAVEDCLLAIKLALALASLNRVGISPEGESAMEPESFAAEYDEHWAQESLMYDVDVLRELAHGDEVLTLDGCVRPFYFGSWMLDSMESKSHTCEEFASHFVEAMRRVQFLQAIEENIYVPSIMDVNSGANAWTMITIAPNFRVLLREVGYISLFADDQLARIPYDDFLNMFAGRLERLDESQYLLVEPIEEDEYGKLLRAYPLNISESPTSKSANRPWWRFWN